MFKTFLDDFFDILFNYRKGLTRVAETKNIGHGLVIFLVFTILSSLSTMSFNAVGNAGVFPPELYPFFPAEVQAELLRFIPLTALMMQLTFGPLYFLLLVAILNFVAELFGGKGSVYSLGAVLGYSYIPYVFVALGGLIDTFSAFNIAGILGIMAFLWSLFLKIAGLSVVHKFSGAKSVLVFFTPLLAVIAAVIIFFLLGVIFLFPIIMQMIEHI